MCRFGSSQRWCCFFWEAGRKKDNISSHLGYHTRTFFLSNIKYLFQSRFACGLHYHLIKNVTGTLPRCCTNLSKNERCECSHDTTGKYRAGLTHNRSHVALIAQLVEHCTSNAKVMGSNPV